MPILCQPRSLAASFGTMDRVHTARRDELIVPPGSYADGFQPADPRGHATGGHDIYDVAFLGIDEDSIRFELRTYGAGDLSHPETSRMMSFPASDKSILLRHLRIDITQATATGMTYRIALDPAGSGGAAQQDSAETETEVVANECQRDRQDIDLARPQP